MSRRLAGVFAVAFAAVLCVPALANSYALVTFDQPSPDPSTYVTPFATFYGGTVEGTADRGYSYDASSSSTLHLGLEFSIFVAPTFPVHEVSFDLTYFSGSVQGAYLNGEADGPGSVDYEAAAYPGTSVVDLISPGGINTIYIYDPGYTPDSSLSIDNVAFNPSLKPVASTPEPPSAVLLATALLAATGCWRFKTRGRKEATSFLK